MAILRLIISIHLEKQWFLFHQETQLLKVIRLNLVMLRELKLLMTLMQVILMT